ncbi:MAG: 4-phosphoerythronate dehydrogenase PdxB [Bacteroidales bacterium]|nr:4-phosphoerythronate dehydrogenase PdxB [Bacteroidales bacterium]
MRIVADDKIPFLKGQPEMWAGIKYMPGQKITRGALMEADALLIRTRTECDAGLLDGTPVKFVATATIGFDHIDTGYCVRNNIFWTNAPGCNSSSVQQYIAAALLKIAAEEKIGLKGRTLGIIGVGNVGSKIEKLARILEMRVLLNDPPRARVEGEDKFVNLATLVRESDIVTVHVPLKLRGEDATWHLFNNELFRMMKKGAWFINTSRGEVVETNSLKQALASRKPLSAVIDVWENEPFIDRDLLKMAFLATPHIAGYSTDGKANGTSMVVNSLCKFFKLPPKEWYPDNVPPPENPALTIECKGKEREAVIGEAVGHTYNIDDDDNKLRSDPGSFEKLRGDYPLRREFPAYSIQLKGCDTDVVRILEDLGFNIYT